MKKSFAKTTALLLALCLVCLLFGSCGMKLRLKNGKIVNPKTGTAYSVVPGVYLPKSVSTEVYAVYELNDVKLEYFAAEGLDPEEWLISEYGDILYSGDVTALPTLETFGATSMFICYNYDTPFTLVNEERPEKVAQVTERFVQGETVNPKIYDHTTYRLLFISDKYPQLYYQLRLDVTEDAAYIFDSTTGRYVDAGYLFSEYPDVIFEQEDYE